MFGTKSKTPRMISTFVSLCPGVFVFDPLSDDTFDAIPYQWHVKVDHVAQSFAGQFQLSQELREEEGIILLASFQFADDEILNEHIQS